LSTMTQLTVTIMRFAETGKELAGIQE